jgi:flagellar basal body rod protein FlgC
MLDDHRLTGKRIKMIDGSGHAQRPQRDRFRRRASNVAGATAPGHDDKTQYRHARPKQQPDFL